MASSLSLRGTRDWTVGHPAASGATVLSLVPALVAVVLFKVAISDGGRHADSLTLVQTAIFTVLAVVVAAGSARVGLIGRALLGMIAAVILTSVWSVQPESSLRELLLWTMYFGIAVVVGSTLGSMAAARRFLDAAAVVGGWLCLIAAFNYWGANNPGMRWYSTFYWPNPFAAFLLLVLPLEGVRLLHATQRREVIMHGVMTVLLGVAFVLTYSRGAWLSLIAVAVLGIAIIRPLSWTTAAVRAVVTAGLVMLVAFALTSPAVQVTSQPAVVGRAASIADPADPSIQGRLHFWRAAIAIFRDHPWTGTGPGTFGVMHARYQQDIRFYAKDAHNLYVQIAAEMGVAGLAALVFLLGSFAALWARTLHHARGREEYPLIAGVGLGLAAFFAHSAVDMDWMFPANPAMAFALVGVLAWYDRAMSSSGAPRRVAGWPARVAVVVTLLAGVALVQILQSAQHAYILGLQLARTGQWAQAAAQYTRAARLDPLQARYLSAEAAALAQMRPPQFAGAQSTLVRAMAVDPMNPSHPMQLAGLITALQTPTMAQLADAEALIHRALALDPLNRPEAYQALAHLYVRQGRMADAAAVYSQAVPLYLSRGLGRNSITYVLLWPEVVDLVSDAAEFSWRRGERDAAVRMLRAVTDEDPGAVRAALQLSAIYVRMGRTAKAREVLHAAAARVPNHPEIQAALAALR